MNPGLGTIIGGMVGAAIALSTVPALLPVAAFAVGGLGFFIGLRFE